jgi:hypothetical protein
MTNQYKMYVWTRMWYDKTDNAYHTIGYVIVSTSDNYILFSYLSGARLAKSLVCVGFCRSLFDPFRLIIVLSVLSFTASDYRLFVF